MPRELGIDQVNGHILASVVTGGQEFARPAGEIVAAASEGVDRLEAALGTQDSTATKEALDALEQAASQLGVSVQATDALTRQLVGDEAAAGVQENLVAPTDGIQSAIAAIRAENSAVSPDRIAQLRASLATINDNFQEFMSADAAVLVQPFRSEVQLAVEGVDNVTDWYAPAAVVLMLQQFGVAFGALSFVRERQLGIVDVYRIAPVNALETLVGKYLAYLLLGGAVGAVLLALVVGVLGVPVAAGIGTLVIVMALTLFAAVGLGFLISLASTTDTQAVQYTILVLLSSLFFSGFFLSLGQLEGAARVASGLLPVSYGMALLRDVMLRGAPIDRPTGIALAAYGVGMFALALLGTHRRMSMRR